MLREKKIKKKKLFCTHESEYVRTYLSGNAHFAFVYDPFVLLV